MDLRSFGTHDGTFHADEVTACALLVLYDLIDQDKVVRSRDLKQLSMCEFVCDVGGEYTPPSKRFDHHQLSYQGDLSSAGMVWLYLKELGRVDEKTYLFLRHGLIQCVDAHDNGKSHFEPGVCTISHIISNFVPIHYEALEEEQYEAFQQAVTFVVGHIKRSLERFSYIQECTEKVKDAMDCQKPFLYFDEAMPWIDSFFDLNGESHPALFVVMPSGGHWKVRAIPPTGEDRMKMRKPLPAKWAGLLEKQLQQVSGIEGAVFCHKGLFISVWETKEAALCALEEALKGVLS